MFLNVMIQKYLILHLSAQPDNSLVSPYVRVSLLNSEVHDNKWVLPILQRGHSLRSHDNGWICRLHTVRESAC